MTADATSTSTTARPVNELVEDGWARALEPVGPQVAKMGEFLRAEIHTRWLDEWFKHVSDYNTTIFEVPWERNPLWMNAMDPEKNFGIVGFEPTVPVPLLRGNADALA